jgi:hypothetical protein
MRTAPVGRSKPTGDTQALKRELARIGQKHERAPTGDALEQRTGRGIVAMKGRVQPDGTRKGARITRRLTLFLPLEVADELDALARKRGMSLSNVAAEALAEHWAITLEAVG